MHIAITGGGGFLARGMAIPLAAAGHRLRIFDVRAGDTSLETVVGDVAKLDDARRALDGCDGLVIAHMAPRTPNAYETPELCFDINVRGTANLFFAANERGIRRAVVVSSTATIMKYPMPWRHDLPGDRPGAGLYSLTKACQEQVARFAADHYGMSVAVLRIGYVVDGEAMLDKYGRAVAERNEMDTDRRDVGEVARKWLESDLTGYETFQVMSTHEAMDSCDLRYTCERLGWEPRYDFDRLPLPDPAKVAVRRAAKKKGS
jgi:nucleoside-diphosphate-sugar epimerase